MEECLPSNMKTEIQRLIDILEHTFEKNAWHGPAMMEVLTEIDERIVNKKLNDTHSILELVAHMTAWRNFVTERLLGNTSFEVSEEMNFPASSSWSQAVDSLRQSQSRLIDSLEKFPVERLNELVANRPYKFSTMAHGIIHHDLYHLGQIVLIKKIHQ